MSLPRLYLIADIEVARTSGLDLLSVLARCLDALPEGAAMVQLRGKGPLRSTLRDLAPEALALCRQARTPLLINGDQTLAVELGADGIHMAESEPHHESSSFALRGRSAHSAESLKQATREAMSYVLISPVFPTPSKPGVAPLGPEGTESLLTSSPAHPLAFGLGGIGTDNAPLARSAGCHGVAAIRSWLSADDPGRAARALLDAVTR